MFSLFLDGKFRFASYYGDHMVLQKAPERAVLWGYGPDDSEVTVSLSGPFTNKAPAVNVNKGEQMFKTMSLPSSDVQSWEVNDQIKNSHIQSTVHVY